MSNIVQFVIDDRTVDPGDASWYCYAPCGCCCGAVAADPGDDEVIAAEEQAWRELEPSAEQRRRDRAAGYVMRLGLRDQAQKLLGESCPHIPRWGVTPTPVPKGYQWATKQISTNARDRSHLVLADALQADARASCCPGEPPNRTGRPNPAREALCGAYQRERWHAVKRTVNSTVKCSRCQGKARGAEEASA